MEHSDDHHQYEIHRIKAPYLQLGIILMAVFMAILDTSVVNVAIPKLESDLSATTDQIQWVLTGYMLVSGVVIPISGWLTDRFGAKRLFIYSLITFTIGSALCGMAWNLDTMILFRILQAAGGGFMMPVANAMIFRIFPPDRRGTVMGIFGLTLMVAPALGPALGGYFVQYASWRLIFYINVPIGIVATIMAILILYNFPYHAKEKLDIWGFMFSIVGFFSILFGINNVSQYGWGSLWVYPFIGLGIGMLIMLIATEVLIDYPVIQLRVFKSYMFTMSLLITSVVQIGLFVGIFLLPLYLQDLMGYSALQTGLFMTPAALMSAVMMPISGKLFDKIGARPLGLIGLIIVTIATYEFAFLNLNTSFMTIQLLYIFRSLGMSMVMMPVMTAGMNMVPIQWMSQASAVSNAVRQIAGSLGIAILTSYMSHRDKVSVFQMSQNVAANTPQGLQLANLQTAVLAHGVPASMSHTIALYDLYGWIQNQGFIDGMNNTFMVSTLLVALAFVLTWFYGSKKERELRRKKSLQGGHSAAPAME